jgi:hypothetical protein
MEQQSVPAAKAEFDKDATPETDAARLLADLVVSDMQKVYESEERDHERQTAYVGRLMFLDGATITLTFTALGVIGTKLPAGHGFVNTSELFWSWSLLIWSMIFSIVSQKILLFASAEFAALGHGRIMESRMARIRTSMNPLLKTAVMAAASKLSNGFLDSAQKRISRWKGFGKWVLFVAEASTIAAFVLLLFFMEANVRAL